MLNIKKNIELFLEKLPVKKPKIMLGLSGGADSIFLFEQLKELHNQSKLTLECAHFNHKWRDSAEVDEQFCEKITAESNIILHTSNPDKLQKTFKYNGSREEIARKMRLLFFEQLKQKVKYDFLALAHHKDDQIETFFIRLARGSTIDGLSCMKEVQGNTIRPLLDIPKTQIMYFLKINQIDFREDETNKSEDFLRNRIRHKLIPVLEQIDERFLVKIPATIRSIQKSFMLAEHHTEKNIQKVFKEGIANFGDLAVFEKLTNPEQSNILMKILINQDHHQPSNALIKEIIRFLLLSNKSNTHQISKKLYVLKKRKSFAVQKY